jgi:hypothetical protein
MKKIQTLFKRDWEGKGNITREYCQPDVLDLLKTAVATEKLDGTNVRLTVRNHFLIRLEKRRNPDKTQKARGINEPWYVDADEFDPGDKYIWEAARGTDLSEISDGEFSAEAVGPRIQGNSLNLTTHRVVFFTLGQAPVFEDVPFIYDDLKEWLPAQKSKYGNDCGIEGIVWHCPDGQMFKIKTKDF